MIDPATLAFPPLHCSREARLGDYYQDFSDALVLVKSGYHGRMGGDGIPLLDVPGQGQFANAVTTAQYGLANLTAVRRGEQQRERVARAQLDWLVANQERDGCWAGCWLMRHDNQKYRWLRAPWTGSLASGNAISALLRGHEMFGDDAYRISAESAYDALHSGRTWWPLVVTRGEDLWYEEYPADEPLHVLNGHLYTLLAVLDYARVTGDREAGARWKKGSSTALRHLAEFDLGYWSIYDLRFREHTNVHYHKNIHIPLLRIMAALTGEGEFADMADRWEGYLGSRIARVRQAVGLRVNARLRR